MIPKVEELYFSGEKQYAAILYGSQVIRLRNLSYISFTPQQNIIPVYSVFSDLPTMFMRGNFLIKGMMGFNAALQEFWAALLEKDIVQKYGPAGFYIQHLGIFVPSVIDDKDLFIERGYILDDVYITGGGMNFQPDGTPVQEVYSFFARRLTKQDTIKPVKEMVEEYISPGKYRKAEANIRGGR